MPFVSDIDTGLPETPSIKNPDLYEEFLTVYNAIRALQDAIEDGGPGAQGPQGPQGVSGDGTVGIPIFIALTESFTVPENKQVLFSYPITVAGLLVIDGILVQVD